MRLARIAYNGMILTAYPEGNMLRTTQGQLLAPEEVVWLPPIEPTTIFALGLNYSAHAKELNLPIPKQPMIFLKGPNTLIGHRGYTTRPDEVKFMHYECELAVIIGKSGKYISMETAHEHIGGYTIANDYAIRDYLEQYYRPNLRVKNRDGTTPLGPWFVPADEIVTPGSLWLRTYVNSQLVQEGNTDDLIFDIPFIISYISSFMTLQRGDVILTGTPAGLVDVNPGDRVVTEIEGLGRLENTIIAAVNNFNV